MPKVGCLRPRSARRYSCYVHRSDRLGLRLCYVEKAVQTGRCTMRLRVRLIIVCSGGYSFMGESTDRLLLIVIEDGAK